MIETCHSDNFEGIEYYRRTYPKVFDGIEENKPFKSSDIEVEIMQLGYTLPEPKKSVFVANGSGKWRSPWYDVEDLNRSPRDMAQYIVMVSGASGDMVFSSETLRRVLTEDCKEADYNGEITFDIVKNKITNYRFEQNAGRHRLKWWGKLSGSRPAQNHNYIIGCDIALGNGQSNSVASVYDVDTHRKVGSWVCPNTSPTNFAEQVTALGLWVGGLTKKAFLIWEANGPGIIFDRRVFELGYDHIYRRTDEEVTYRKRAAKRGWYSSPKTKMQLLGNYDAALASRFKMGQEHRAFFNPDKVSIHEAEDYIIFPNGFNIGKSSCADEEGSAKAAHGDRVIADALCCLARYDQPAAAFKLIDHSDEGSFGYRMQMRQETKRKELENRRWLVK